MNKNIELQTKIDELIKLDNAYQTQQAEKYPNGIMISVDSPEFNKLIKSVLSNDELPVITALKKMSINELTYIMALMWYGRGDVDATFDYFLKNAEEDFEQKDFDMNISYIAGKPLGVYLAKGLERINS